MVLEFLFSYILTWNLSAGNLGNAYIRQSQRAFHAAECPDREDTCRHRDSSGFEVVC